MASLTPNTPELIQRNLSSLKHHLRMMRDPMFANWHKKEAVRLIQIHNQLVAHNKNLKRLKEGM